MVPLLPPEDLECPLAGVPRLPAPPRLLLGLQLRETFVDPARIVTDAGDARPIRVAERGHGEVEQIGGGLVPAVSGAAVGALLVW